MSLKCYGIEHVNANFMRSFGFAYCNATGAKTRQRMRQKQARSFARAGPEDHSPPVAHSLANESVRLGVNSSYLLSAQKSRESAMAKNGNPPDPQSPRLRSQLWFDNPDDPGMTALYLERYLNYGLTREELTSGRPIIAIAQTGSDLSPCNRHHLQLAERVRTGIRDAGGIALEFPVHPIQETGKRPTAALDRNLAYLGLVEGLHGYPLD